MLPHFPPAVYKCIIPVEESLTASSAVYHSPLDRSGQTGQKFYFPAWPEIQDSHQPLCLPTLMRAIYFEHQQAGVECNSITTRIEKYLSRLQVFEPEIREQAIAYAKSRQIFFVQHSVELDKHLQVDGTIAEIIVSHNAFIGYTKSDHFQERVYEAVMQASIYGNLENFRGAKDAFAYTHEFAHRGLRVFHSGVVLDELSKSSHKTLEILATQKRLSRNKKRKLWVKFVKTNTQITHITQKFEPLEEIYATYMGLRFLPIELRNIVERRVKEALEARNWLQAYDAFVDICENSPIDYPLEIAINTFDIICILLEANDINLPSLLSKISEMYNKVLWPHFKIIEQIQQGNAVDENEVSIVNEEVSKKSDSMLKQMGIRLPENWYDNEIDEKPEQRRILSQVTLVGRSSRKEVAPLIHHFDSQQEDDHSWARVFFESLRQQLSQRCGIVCPFAYKGRQECCGLIEPLVTLYERLPREDKNDFKEPNCCLIR